MAFFAEIMIILACDGDHPILYRLPGDGGIWEILSVTRHARCSVSLDAVWLALGGVRVQLYTYTLCGVG